MPDPAAASTDPARTPPEPTIQGTPQPIRIRGQHPAERGGECRANPLHRRDGAQRGLCSSRAPGEVGHQDRHRHAQGSRAARIQDLYRHQPHRILRHRGHRTAHRKHEARRNQQPCPVDAAAARPETIATGTMINCATTTQAASHGVASPWPMAAIRCPSRGSIAALPIWNSSNAMPSASTRLSRSICRIDTAGSFAS